MFFIFRVSLILIAATSVGLFDSHAIAQSDALVSSLRTNAPTALTDARRELLICKRQSCSERDRLTLLVGYLMLADGDARGAAKLLRSARAPRGLEAYFHWYLGEAFAWSGDASAALSSFARAQRAAPSQLKEKLNLRVAELNLQMGRAILARPVFEKAAAAKATAELLLFRAMARKATGDRSGALADVRQLFIRHPAHPHAAAGMRLLEPEKIDLTDTEKLARTRAWLDARRYSECLDELEVLNQRIANMHAQRFLLQGQALLGLQRFDEAEAALGLAARESSTFAAEALLTLAKRQMRQGDHSSARKSFQEIDRRFSKTIVADDAGYFAAWLAMQSGDDQIAAQEFQAWEEAHPQARKRDEARWFRALAFIHQKRFAESRQTLAALVRDYPQSSLVPQARYWAARSADLLGDGTRADGGDTSVAADEYSDLIRQFPGSFYARLAAERLSERGMAPAAPFTAISSVAVRSIPPELKLAVLLTRAGLLIDAREEIDRLVTRIQTAAEAARFGRALQSIGEFGAAYALSARLLWGAAFSQKDDEALALMFPRAFASNVTDASQDYGIDPHLAWAIMRRESAFRPEVQSSADARGLMQIIPPTASAISSTLGIEAPHPDELFSPETNIRLGVWYLSALMKRFGHPALVAAAYNAGPSAAVKWIRQKPELPIDLFIEEIPYKETRGYVKQVVGDLFIYQALWGDRVGRLSLELPASIGDGVTF